MGSSASETSSVESGLLVLAIATAVSASCFATSGEISGDEANPHVPSTMTRTPTPVTVSSDCVSERESRN
ncbi:unannotated protein [freshwater metagenome]|uniref:Unannotated protein n=1 Tax=freshwater metagenome TaxID=449393 RepID=A0A6J6QJ84_9ZZZZ